jgi:ketosteroid isomerase-like protein
MRERRWGRGTSCVLGVFALLFVLGGCGQEKEEPKVQVAQEDRNIDLLRRGYESFGKGDVPGALALFDDSIVFHVPGTSQLAGDHRGKAAVGAFMGKLKELSGGTFKLQPTQIMANNTFSAVVTQISATRNTRTIAEQPVHLWRFEGGEPVEFWLYPQDQRAFDEFWS